VAFLVDGKFVGVNIRVVRDFSDVFPEELLGMPPVGPVLRRRRSSRKKRPSAEAVCVRWPKVPLHEASVLQTINSEQYSFTVHGFLYWQSHHSGTNLCQGRGIIVFND
jgi:hypothetical protein